MKNDSHYWSCSKIDGFWIDLEILIRINRNWFNLLLILELILLIFFGCFFLMCWLILLLILWLIFSWLISCGHWSFGSKGYWVLQPERVYITLFLSWERHIPKAWKSFLCWESWKRTAFGFGKGHEQWKRWCKAFCQTSCGCWCIIQHPFSQWGTCGRLRLLWTFE